MAHLVIVESPAKAKTIAKYLGKDYVVAASAGHVRDLPKEFGIDIANDFAVSYEVIDSKRNAVQRLLNEARRAQDIVLASDPDREGEAIAWHISEILGMDGSLPCRAEFHEITKNGVKKGLEQVRPLNYQRIEAQQTRRTIDRLVGYKLSGALSYRLRTKGLSAGRVQSVALRLLCDRQREIDAFVKQEFWKITAIFQNAKDETFTAELVTQKPLHNQDITERALEYIREQQFLVDTVEKKRVRRSAPPPFTTSALQQAASSRIKIGAKETMDIAQQLYEGINLADGPTGLITYMRTDSVRTAPEFQEATRKYVTEVMKLDKAYLPPKAPQFKNKGDNVQDAHEAIRPTHIELTPEQVKPYLNARQFGVYKLVYERYLASQMAAAVNDVTTVHIAGGKARFKASGSVEVFPGFTIIWQEEPEKEKPAKKSKKGKEDNKDEGENGDDDKEEDTGRNQRLPALEAQDPLQLNDLQSRQSFTKPPAYFTEASLIKKMEESGVGRPSTYAPTIETLFRRQYSQTEKRRLLPTDLGKLVDGALREHFPEIISVEYTAGMEARLDDIEAGKQHYVPTVREFFQPLTAALRRYTGFDAFAERPEGPRVRQETGEACPVCGKSLLIRENRRTGEKFVGCSGYPECSYTRRDLTPAVKPEPG
ncbi:MAG TPA: type I DNA topoisomerase [Patescibacteria group bacterium]|nr:type I DNA topoisomerase [Patescibacteria group bacterium]